MAYLARSFAKIYSGDAPPGLPSDRVVANCIAPPRVLPVSQHVVEEVSKTFGDAAGGEFVVVAVAREDSSVALAGGRFAALVAIVDSHGMTPALPT